MPNQSAPTRYSAVAQGFHWLIAALIVVQFTLGWTAQFLPLGARKVDRLDWHKSFGMTILMLAGLRLLWRLFNRPPELPVGMSTIEKRLARATHILFYVLLFVMPLTGWVMSSAKNFSVSWFHQFTWPNLIEPNEPAFNLLRTTHDTLSWLLFALALLHVLAALKHHFWNKDDVLKRMLPFTKSEKRI
jgi:cytochrome b561